jgi:hypothetical protein
MVTASRRHLTDRYASGVERLLWDTEKRFIPDLDAIKLVAKAASSGRAEALDVGAALVLLQAARLELDGLEFEIFEGAHAMGMGQEALAAVLELPDAAAADQRWRWLKTRWELPRAEAELPHQHGAGNSAEAAARAGRRAHQAAGRAAQAVKRREELHRGRIAGQPVGADDVERAAANASQARVLAGEAAERVALGLLRAAAALDRCAAGCHELIRGTGNDARPQLRQKADEYHRAAVRCREMAAEYRALR